MLEAKRGQEGERRNGEGAWSEGNRSDPIRSDSIRFASSVPLHTNPGTEAEPQQIVAQRLLSCLQYHVPFKSSTEDLTQPTLCFMVKYRVDIKLSLLQHRSR